MAYSATIKQAIGDVRNALARSGLERQSSRFAEHGRHRPDDDAPTVLVACSGGRDSMALAAVSHIVCGMLGLHCGAVIVDHRLQPGSDQVVQEAANRCKNLGLDPVLVRTISVEGRENGRSEEEVAREARYAALAQTARGIADCVVLLAHTRDDQAETVIMDLMRSGGIDALAGMPSDFEREGVRFTRPFLDITRGQTTRICQELSIEWWDDPTNGDSVPANELLPQGYPLRSRVRHTLMPYLSSFFGGDFSAHLAKASATARTDKDFLEETSENLYRAVVSWNGDVASSLLADRIGDSTAPVQTNASSNINDLQISKSSNPVVADTSGDLDNTTAIESGEVAVLQVKPLAVAHPAIRRRVIARVLAQLGIAFNSGHVLSIDALVTCWHGQGALSLPSGYSVNRQKHVIRVCKNG
ncbi:tRNA lysidine(34) synthetase TilS [Bifidobacterium sp. ESL0745]|uniref:tRNA lysidine(34) synthetase TilS n=1 Tax=Bifidobacterium sp. ESL0745 TaxID=2983226 RepID=UPI0023F92530|nr:tRNA lysidine(34) synthetase TilS [Bifidobacterium sp. ESL0745]MDF7665376.1 tRNA lysidine(34) synthetase TilS [Bifidobacterium sp. ESL0745]